MVHVVLRNVLD